MGAYRSTILQRLCRAAVLAGVCCLAFMGHATAGWKEDLGTFRIGMVAEPGSGQAIEGLAEIKRAYTMALGLPVQVFVADDFAALIDAQATGRIEYAVYSATAFATASQLCGCVEPIAAPIGADGSTGLRAILVTRDKRLASVDEVGTHRVATVAGDSVAGFALPGSALASAFDEPQGGALVSAETASAAEAMLADGSVDAIFGWALASPDAAAKLEGGTLQRLAAAGIDPETLSVVWSSETIRYGPHALRQNLDPEAKASLTIFLGSMLAQTPELYDLLERRHGGGFQPVSQADYATAIEMVKRIAERAQ